MEHPPLKVMAVDDDVMNLEILIKNLKDSGFESIGFEDGDAAWNYLSSHPEDIDVVLLDKMMPKMNGMEVLARMKQHETLSSIPVILQTGDVGDEETKAGLNSGAYYYLEKPFDPTIMVALVNAASRDCVKKNEMLQQIKQDSSITKMIVEGRFILQTMEDARKLSAALACHAKKTEEISLALSEILVNAIEHGNLGIGYNEKSELISNLTFDDEIERRQQLPENKVKYIDVQFQRNRDTITVIIADQGPGFDWKKYLEFDPIRLSDPNGRGIAAAGLMGLKLEYIGKGNKVICSFPSKNKI